MTKRTAIFALMFCMVLLSVIGSNFGIQKDSVNSELKLKAINGKVQKGESFFDIFKKYNINPSELFKIKEASANIHRLKKVHPGQDYKIVIDEDNRVNEFIYWIDDDNVLSVSKNNEGFEVEKVAAQYDTKTLYVSGVIMDNLVSSMSSVREGITLALELSDIFAWDIDFTSDLRKGDAFKVLVEGLYLEGEFKKYGNIMSAEFSNGGRIYRAYRFEADGNASYYDEHGKSLKKSFLKAPLSFRRISSSFSGGRHHPILKVYRPHHGLDYAAASGTPVSAIGDATVKFAGHRGQYGNLVILKHPNGWLTYYGHLSKFARGVNNGAKVNQGQIIGCVGSTGLATGPHLHYEMRIEGRPVNPLTIKLPDGSPVPKEKWPEFVKFKSAIDAQLASIAAPDIAALMPDMQGNKI